MRSTSSPRASLGGLFASAGGAMAQARASTAGSEVDALTASTGDVMLEGLADAMAKRMEDKLSSMVLERLMKNMGK